MPELITGYFDKQQPMDRLGYVSKNKVAIALRGLEFFFTVYGEGKPMPETDALREGRMLHEAILEPELWRRNKQVYRMASNKSQEFRDWEKRVLREYPGSHIMSLQESLRYDRIIDKVMSHKMAGDLIRRAVKECHGYAVCPRTGAQLYSRPDIITPEGWMGELKFVKCIDQFEFNREQFKYKWFMQLAFYNFVDGEIRKRRLQGNCFYIAVEPFHPHRVFVHTLSSDFEKMGNIDWNEGMDKINACLKIDPQMRNYEVWRALSNRAAELKPEMWMMNNDERYRAAMAIGG